MICNSLRRIRIEPDLRPPQTFTDLLFYYFFDNNNQIKRGNPPFFNRRIQNRGNGDDLNLPAPNHHCFSLFFRQFPPPRLLFHLLYRYAVEIFTKIRIQFRISSSSSSSRWPIASVRSETKISSPSPIQALIFDCDGVILESEHLHRQAYNDAFVHFDVRCPSSASAPLNWPVEFYDELQNRIGGGKPKMRWYFGEHGWPASTILSAPPADDMERAKLIDTLQDWKTERYKDIIRSGSVKPRPGVLQLMDGATAAVVYFTVHIRVLRLPCALQQLKAL